MHYKRKKPHRDEPSILGPPRLPPMQPERERTSPAKKPYGYCKKLKGPHEYDVVETRDYSYMLRCRDGKLRQRTWIWTISRCRGCTKKKETHNKDLLKE